MYTVGYVSRSEGSHNGNGKRKQNYPHRVVDIAYSGHWLGGDRAVRSNVPYPFKPRVAIYTRSADNSSKVIYQIGVALHSYFEITLSGVDRPDVHRVFGSSMVSIGFANAYFHLVDKQPGEENSLSIHVIKIELSRQDGIFTLMAIMVMMDDIITIQGG